MRIAWAILLGGCSVLNGLREAPGDGGPADAVIADAFERIDGVLPPGIEVVGVFPAVPSREVDILFVIDNSGSMAEEQASLAANFPNLINALEQVEGGLPSLHIGVISSNTGAGGQAIATCAGDGDNGRLQNAPRLASCTPPLGFYIQHEIDASGNVTTNYTGTLSDTFACIASLGTMGCGFEQHLESVLRALDGRNPENAGFLREGAYLAIIIVADEDDCSAADAAVFDPTQDSIDSPLGPMTSFRCAEFGILCNGQPIGRAPRDLDPADGTRVCAPQGRVVASDSGYLWHPQRYVDFLRSVKQNPALLVVAAITGPPEPVSIMLEPEGGDPKLTPACTSQAGGNADPTVRFHAFLDGFPARNGYTRVCDENLAPGLTAIGNLVAGSLGQSCLVGALYDASGDPGVQPDCRVWDVVAYGQPNELRSEIPACSGAASPCYELAVDQVSCPYDTNLEVNVVRSGTPPADVTVVVECRRP